MKTPRRNSSADALLIAALDSVSDVYYAIDRDWRFLMCNSAAERFFGAKRDEILGTEIWELFPPGLNTEFSRRLEAAMNEKTSSRWLTPSALRPGRIVEIWVAPLGDEGVGVSVDDVTERTLAERAMRESQQRMDLAVSAHRIGVFDWHVPSGAATWSPEMEMIFGLEPETFEGHTSDFLKRVLPEDQARIGEQTEAAIARREEVVFQEFRIVRADGAVRWIEGAARIIYNAEGGAERVVGTNIDVTDRKQAELRQQMLNNELNHRVKNTLAIVQAIAWQSFRGAPETERESFEGRLVALSAAHDALTTQNWELVDVGQIISGATAPHHDGEGRFTAEGPAVELPSKTAVAVGLAMHELATNAVKHGALSSREGRVEVRWTVKGDRLRLTWRETGGPAVREPTRRGFGLRLLEHGLAEELAGAVKLDFRPTGLVCTLEAELKSRSGVERRG